MITRRRTVIGFALALVLVLLAPRVSLAQQEVVLATVGGSFAKTIEDQIGPRFEKAYNVKLRLVPGNATETLARVQATKDNPQIDVSLLDDGPASQGILLGLFQPMDPAAVPNLKSMYPFALRDKNICVDSLIVASGFMYNTKVFKEKGWRPPTSWNDLFRPEFSGRLLIPPIQNTHGLETLIMLARLNGGGERNIEPGFQAMQKLKSHVVVFEAEPGKQTDLFIHGQAVLMVWNTGRVYAFQSTGFPVDFVYPAEGAFSIALTACVTKNTKRPKLANELVNFLISEEGQLALANGTKFGPLNSRVKLDPDLARKVPYGLEQINKLVKKDWDYINQHRAEWTERWNREIER